LLSAAKVDAGMGVWNGKLGFFSTRPLLGKGYVWKTLKMA
jgi:hypothetical protein